MRSNAATAIFTIGHSNHPWDQFVSLLRASKISVLIDVRSVPRSRFAHFNQAPLTTRLAALDIGYHHMGTELGGRTPSGAPLDYEAVDKSAAYREALMDAVAIARSQRAVLMCSEHEPLSCHRCLLLGRSLAEQGLAVRHILRSGEVESHAEAESRLLEAARRKIDHLASPHEQMAEAYRAQIRKLQGNYK